MNVAPLIANTHGAPSVVSSTPPITGPIMMPAFRPRPSRLFAHAMSSSRSTRLGSGRGRRPERGLRHRRHERQGDQRLRRVHERHGEEHGGGDRLRDHHELAPVEPVAEVARERRQDADDAEREQQCDRLPRGRVRLVPHREHQRGVGSGASGHGVRRPTASLRTLDLGERLMKRLLRFGCGRDGRSYRGRDAVVRVRPCR